jgi:aminoglycoside 3-N-acetyltransferase
MSHTRDSLATDLRRLGLKPGDVVMVHSSVRAVGPVTGGPDQIHLAIEDAVSPGGTVVMILSCGDGYDEVGRGHLSPQEETALLAFMPAFDPFTARAARDNGTLVEFFRTWPGTIPSAAVTTRLGARGARAGWLMEPAPLTFPFGKGSGFERLLQANAKILMLGADHDTVTLLHYAEQEADFPDKIVKRYRMPVLRDGARVWVDGAEFDSSKGAHVNWPDRFFAQIVDAFIAKTAPPTGRIGDAGSVLLDANALIGFAMPLMVRTAREGWR